MRAGVVRNSLWLRLLFRTAPIIAASGEITEILDMEAQSLAPVPSKFAVRYALELPKGAFTRLGIKVGDRIEIPQL